MSNIDPIDKKWLTALGLVYPVIGATLPFYRFPDGVGIDADRTLLSFFRLIGIKLSPEGRILEPHGLS